MMMTYAKSPALKNLLYAVLTTAGLMVAGGASAADLGVGTKADVEVQGDVGTPAGGAKIEGSAESGVSTEGSLNQNAQGQPEATRGLDRAQERMSPMGKEHEQATELEGATEESLKARKGSKTTGKKRDNTSTTHE